MSVEQITLTVNEPIRDEHQRQRAHISVRPTGRHTRRFPAPRFGTPVVRYAKLVHRAWGGHLLDNSR